MAVLFLNLILCSCMGILLADGEDNGSIECPIWNLYNNITGQCESGSDLEGVIKFSDNMEKSLSLERCYCMTFDHITLKQVVGSCIYTCNFLFLDKFHPLYNIVKSKQVTDLNNETCGHYNRRDTMCGECVVGYGVPVYSYTLSCVECSEYKYNWMLYIAVAYIPPTIFYIAIIVLRISVSHGLMIGYVTVSQMTGTHSLITLYLGTFHIREHYFLRMVALLYSIWNLDFFRSLYPPFCLHPHMSPLRVLILDYVLAVYPMMLVILTYHLLRFLDRFNLTVLLCKPLRECYRKEWNIKASLIGTFATMLLLSYVKILDVTLTLLTPYYFGYVDGSRGPAYYFAASNKKILQQGTCDLLDFCIYNGFCL